MGILDHGPDTFLDFGGAWSPKIAPEVAKKIDVILKKIKYRKGA